MTKVAPARSAGVVGRHVGKVVRVIGGDPFGVRVAASTSLRAAALAGVGQKRNKRNGATRLEHPVPPSDHQVKGAALWFCRKLRRHITLLSAAIATTTVAARAGLPSADPLSGAWRAVPPEPASGPAARACPRASPSNHLPLLAREARAVSSAIAAA